MSEAIKISGLTKSYNGRIVLNNLDLIVKTGTVFGLLGANGAGKSTTIECILGTKRSDSGEIFLLGQDPQKQRRGLSGIYWELAAYDVINTKHWNDGRRNSKKF